MSIEITPETKEIQTPTKEHKLVIKAYLTGFDKREYRRKLIELGQKTTDETRLQIEDEFDNYKIGKVVLSVDGSKDDIVNDVLKMKAIDYNYVQGIIDEMILGLTKKNESPSTTSTPTSSEEESPE